MLTLNGSFNNNFSGCEVKQEIILPPNDSTSEFSPYYLNLDKPANLDHKNGNEFPYHRHIAESSYTETQNLQRQLASFKNSTSTSIKNSNPLSPPSESTLTTLDDKHTSSVLIPSTANTTISIKRGRTSFTSSQLVQLKKEFSRSKYVSKKRREEIAQELNLAEIQIKIWFQNQRRKNKSTKNQTKRPETPCESQLNQNKHLVPILGSQQAFPSYNQTDLTPAASPQSFATSVESFAASPEPYTQFSESFTPSPEYSTPSEELNIDYRRNFNQPQYFPIGNPFSHYSSNNYYNHKFIDFNFREFYGTQGVAIEYLPNQNFDFSQNKPVISANPVVNIPWYGQQYCGNY